MARAAQLVNVETLASELGLSVSRCHQLTKLGLPRASRGKYDVYLCLKWLVRFQRGLIERHESETGSTSADRVRVQRARLLEIRAAAAEVELNAQQGTLIPLSVFSAQMSAMISTARAQLLQLPGRVAPNLVGENAAVIKFKLTRAVHEALTALAARGASPEAMPADPAPPEAANGKGEAPESATGPTNGAES